MARIVQMRDADGDRVYIRVSDICWVRENLSYEDSSTTVGMRDGRTIELPGFDHADELVRAMENN